MATNRKDFLEYYIDLIRDENDFKFYNTALETGKQVFSEVVEDPTFVLLKEAGEEKAVFSRYGLPKRYFKEFLRYHEFKAINLCSDKALKFLNEENPERTLIMLFHSENDTSFEEMRNEFAKIAEEMRSIEYLFIMTNISEGPCKNFAESNGIRANKLPTFQIVQLKNGKLNRYSHEGPFTQSAINKFIKEWKQGMATQVYKSEDPPASNPGPVYTVVGTTFDEMVIKAKEDVLVKFYAPWCGHCKKLAPVYEELAKKMASNNHVKLVEIDLTQNEVPSVTIEGYPTLKLYKADDKKYPIPYSGERTVEAIEKFLKENSSFKTEKKPDL